MTTHNKTNSSATAQRAVASGPLGRASLSDFARYVELVMDLVPELCGQTAEYAPHAMLMDHYLSGSKASTCASAIARALSP